MQTTIGQSLTAAQRISHDLRTRRGHGATSDAPAENIRPKHDIFFSRARAKCMRTRCSRELTSCADRRESDPRPTGGSAAVGARVWQALHQGLRRTSTLSTPQVEPEIGSKSFIKSCSRRSSQKLHVGPYFRSLVRGIGYSFQLAITTPRINLIGYGTATAQSYRYSE